MEKSAGNVNLASVRGGQDVRAPAAVRGTFAAKIDDHVVRAAAHDRYELGHPRIAVQSAQYPAMRKREVVLNERFTDPGRTIPIEGVRLFEKAARIVEDARRQQQRTCER